jgi:hypothetical protein
MRSLVELVMRLPGGAFWGLVVAGLFLGAALIIGGIVLLALKRKAGAALLGLGVLAGGGAVMLLFCLFADLICDARGTWIC